MNIDRFEDALLSMMTDGGSSVHKVKCLQDIHTRILTVYTLPPKARNKMCKAIECLMEAVSELRVH